MSPTQNTHKKCSFCNKNLITTPLIDINAITQILKNNKHEIIYEYAECLCNQCQILLQNFYFEDEDNLPNEFDALVSAGIAGQLCVHLQISNSQTNEAPSL
ncbi:hypothetical protein F8M41_022487 [Gigaspora margarita]|uniref:Uncharacterized protein n=1 Tax=Gigaspora margarita TaxID=4874 RepID=A0A8H4AEY0_GIGMA|nr:hypothetical protein F8M41_022487 [Gigaspora margarita]